MNLWVGCGYDDNVDVRSRSTPQGVDFRFWVDWYDAAMAGKHLNWDMQHDITLIADEVWKGDASVLMDRINGIWRRYYPIDGTNDLLTTGFLQYALSDFTFDEIRQVMKMVAEPDEVAHLKKGSKLTSFLDDAEELVDGLNDFGKSVSATTALHQEVAPVGIYTQSLIDEFARAKDQDHLRLRRLIDLGDVLQDFSLDAGVRGRMSDPMCKQFDRLVDQLLDLTRSHFAPSLLKLRPLNDLDLALDETPREVVKKLREGLSRIEDIENPELVGMAPEDSAVLAKAIEELEGYLYALEMHGEGDVEEVRNRFKNKAVQVTAAFGKYGVRAREHKDKLGSNVDELMKWVKRTKGIKQAYEFFETLFEGGGPPAV